MSHNSTIIDMEPYITKPGICKWKMISFGKFLNSLILAHVESVDEIKLTDLDTRVNKISDIFAEYDTYQTFIELNCEDADDSWKTRVLKIVVITYRPLQ